LIPVAEVDAEAMGLQQIPVTEIKPNPYQPRTSFDEESLAELADSIREVGLLQPILVRPAGDAYELIAGERRWRAARRLGMQTVPALVKTTEDAGALEQALVENVHRAGLDPLEEAAAYQQLVEDFGLSQQQVAARVGRSRVTISNTLRLLQLPPSIQKLVHDGQLSGGHARALLGSPDRSFQEQLARRAVKEQLSVRAVEEAVRTHGELDAADTGSAKAGATTRKLRPPGLLELEELLGDYLETRVRVSMGTKKGRVAVEFSGLDDLERIYVLMTAGSDDPDEVAARG
jgi:ParB family chromosome partitioning protein